MDSVPRTVIPPGWAQQGCCPVCQATKLSVRQTPGAPDQMACAQCGCAFELEAGGSRLALTQGPPEVAAAIGGVTRIWLSLSELHALLQQPPAEGAPVPVPALGSAAQESDVATGTPVDLPSALAHCTEAELMKRAETLLALGNSPLQIQVALVQSGVAPDLVRTVVEATRRLAQQRRQRQLRWTWLLTGLVIACLLLAAGGAWVLSHRPAPPAPSTAETSRPPNGPPTPTGVAGFFLGPPTSMVQTEPPPTPGSGRSRQTGRCPTSADEASNLFGGQAADWTYKADVGGWLMTAVTPKTVYVPASMVAGYLQFGAGGANMNQVDGPARIQNVNFIAVTCQ